MMYIMPGKRRDAQENRARLLAAGREVFAQHGLDATLNDVAHAAGVGVGTAYRNFANKSELLAAIFETQVDELEAILLSALAEEDLWDGVRFYLKRAVALQYADKAAAQIFAGKRLGNDIFDWSRDRIAPLVNQVGARAGVAGTDLIFLQVGVLAIAERVGDLYPRYLEMAIRGLQAGELPGRALTTDETHRIMRGA